MVAASPNNSMHPPTRRKVSHARRMWARLMPSVSHLVVATSSPDAPGGVKKLFLDFRRLGRRALKS